MPVLFISHGPPSFAVEANPTVHHWRDLPDVLPTAPRAILCVSAHWDAPGPRLAGGLERPAIQHDFSGFAPELYRVAWNVRGSAEWAARVAACFEDAAEPLVAEPERPLDHGVWVPLMAAWPDGDVPVLQLSLSTERGGPWHLELGRRLASLQKEGMLIVASGGVTHNPGCLNPHTPDGDPAPWAARFVRAFEAALAMGDEPSLCDPWALPHGKDCHPTLEHYYPMLVAVGAAGEPLIPIHHAWTLESLALHTYGSGTLENLLRQAA